MLESLLILSIFLPLLFIIIFKPFQTKTGIKSPPKSYPFIGHYFSIRANGNHLVEWVTKLVLNSPTLTTYIHRPFGQKRVITANPSVVKHILKTNFLTYQKGDVFRASFHDFIGDGIFNVSGDEWKFIRQLSSHEFNTNSLRHFVEDVVDIELNERLIPILANAAANNTIIDLQDILQRFSFDSICKISFGYDPKYLIPSLPQSKFAIAFDDALRTTTERFHNITPWKLKRFLNIGSEKRLKEAVSEIRQFSKKVLNQKKQESSIQTVDLLSRFLCSGHTDENFLTDMVINTILAGRETTSASLTWYFWLLSKNPLVISEIVREINEVKSDARVYDEVKDMVYTHASLCESLRLYPPVPVDSKTALADDILPDGTAVKKGMVVTYSPYAMGRVEEAWGPDWMDFRPERWLKNDETTKKVRFVPKDPYTYSVFQAGPRICLGKDMAFLQMKRLVAGVIGRFDIIPATGDDFEPVMTTLTSKMKGGFPVKIMERR
ncbi:cytochrome P450 94A1 [Artemisia annua]|uniref:Cytochrome P450 94A1 n=1 Tax=Artemisia annua TaxID=35608 RepID=A0A2U1MSV8_ARTAN|nr:cytochrome P450 94A1 [Artemisia annua]